MRRRPRPALTGRQRLSLLVPIVGALVTVVGLIVAAVPADMLHGVQLVFVVLLGLGGLLPYAGMAGLLIRETRQQPSFWLPVTLGCLLLTGFGVYTVVNVLVHPGSVVALAFLFGPVGIWFGLLVLLVLSAILRRSSAGRRPT